jgi:Protein of unknown function (DUF4231)
MNEEEYMTNRLEKEIVWYDKRSARNKNLYQLFKTLEIVIAVIIPFLTGYLKENENLKYAIGILGIFIAILSGSITLFKFPEKWIEYRTTAETLKHEKYMFLTLAGPYKSDHSTSNLAERVEYLIAKENSNWNMLINRKDDLNKKP